MEWESPPCPWHRVTRRPWWQPPHREDNLTVALGSAAVLSVCVREFMLGLGLLRLSYENKGRLGDETGLSLLENSPKFILLNRVASPALN